MLALSAAALVICPWVGAKLILPGDIFGEAASAFEQRIFWELRVPRVLLAWCAGATLGVCGALCQALFRNPLAEPSLLGVSSGASLGVAAAIRWGIAGSGTALSAALGPLALPLCAFVGASAALAIITAFARASRTTRDASLLLAGVAISSLFTSLIMIFQYTSTSTESYRLISWTLGGVSAIGIAEGLTALPPMLLSIAAAARCATELDLLTLGDDIASARGVASERVRRALFAVMAISVAAVVSKCGPIGSLGLIAPHAARRVLGPRHLPLSFASAAVGGAALAICDTASRTLWAPADLPVGIMVSALGAPFFLWLLFSATRR